ncbi:MAG: DUF4440 domain-containing protein [Proteobacteria bacterium]|nr:DUF4440 domain-containing protein [Pseudomonadota bacterium]
MKTNPNEFLRTWMQRVNQGEIEPVLAMYNEHAVLIPTFSNRLLGKPQGIREYFERLFSREELSLALHEKTLITQNINAEVWSMSGIYCWRFAIDGELLNFEARFSYLLDFALPAPILHHHSSQIPRVI